MTPPPRSPKNPVTTLIWIICGLIAWLTVAVIVGILTGRAIRGRGHHHPRICDHGHPQVERWSGCDGDECWYGHPIRRSRPTPNHPAVRAHKRLTDDQPLDQGPPLTPAQTAALDQLGEQLR